MGTAANDKVRETETRKKEKENEQETEIWKEREREKERENGISLCAFSTFSYQLFERKRKKGKCGKKSLHN